MPPGAPSAAPVFPLSSPKGGAGRGEEVQSPLNLVGTRVERVPAECPRPDVRAFVRGWEFEVECSMFPRVHRGPAVPSLVCVFSRDGIIWYHLVSKSIIRRKHGLGSAPLRFQPQPCSFISRTNAVEKQREKRGGAKAAEKRRVKRVIANAPFGERILKSNSPRLCVCFVPIQLRGF